MSLQEMLTFNKVYNIGREGIYSSEELRATIIPQPPLGKRSIFTPGEQDQHPRSSGALFIGSDSQVLWLQPYKTYFIIS